MNPEEKKERLRYLRFRLKIICLCIFYLVRLRKYFNLIQANRLLEKNLDVIMFDDEETLEKLKLKESIIKTLKILWYCLMSFWLWFNMITSPMVMLWPDLSNEFINREVWLALWLNELFWILDGVRKIFDKPKGSRA